LPHSIQIFSGGCDICKETAEIVEVGKCKDCKMEVLNVESNKELAKQLGVTSVPSIVIDGRIKVVGKPTFPWFCGDEFYKVLERNYPIKENSGSSTGSASSERRIDFLSSCIGGLGAAGCTITMLLPIFIGTVGAGASVVCSMPGMCPGALWTFSMVASIAQPLLVASLALMLYGIRRFGILPLATTGVGGALLYASMFVLPMSLPLIAVSSAVMLLGYVMAYTLNSSDHYR